MSVDGRLKARLAEQLRSESETLQAATSEQLDAMRSELKAIYADALSTIEADMQSQSKALAKRMRSLILWPSVIWLALLLTLSAGAWGIGQYQWSQIQQHQERLARMEALGVEPVRTEQGREYLLLPEGATVSEVRQTREGQPFIELLRQ